MLRLLKQRHGDFRMSASYVAPVAYSLSSRATLRGWSEGSDFLENTPYAKFVPELESRYQPAVYLPTKYSNDRACRLFMTRSQTLSKPRAFQVSSHMPIYDPSSSSIVHVLHLIISTPLPNRGQLFHTIALTPRPLSYSNTWSLVENKG